MSRAAQLEPQVLARERDDVGEVALTRARARCVASGASRVRVVRRDDERFARRRAPASSRSSSAAPLVVERGERLVEDEQLGVVEQRPAEREPLRHPARERRDALVARLPEAEALEQHADPLAPLRHAVEPAVEVEVLERGQLAVDERLVPEEAELRARSAPTSSSPRVGAARPANEAQQASSCRTRSAR